MLKIGVIIFAIGLLLLSPVDEFLLLPPLILAFGLVVIPIYYIITFGCLIVGAMLLGKHLGPMLLHHPLGILMILIAVVLVVYLWVL